MDAVAKISAFTPRGSLRDIHAFGGCCFAYLHDWRDRTLPLQFLAQVRPRRIEKDDEFAILGDVRGQCFEALQLTFVGHSSLRPRTELACTSFSQERPPILAEDVGRQDPGPFVRKYIITGPLGGKAEPALHKFDYDRIGVA